MSHCKKICSGIFYLIRGNRFANFLLNKYLLAPANVGGDFMAEVKVVNEKQLAVIKNYIESIKYGSVNIIIQDGKIVQIDKSEKIRL